MNDYILKVPYEEEADSGIVGGKGFALNILARKGINIPNTHVLTTKAFKEFVEHNGLETFASFLQKHEVQDNHSMRNYFLEIQNDYEEGIIPNSVNIPVNDFLSKTKAELLAVRSSADCEDGISRAWAGQFNSFLNTPKSQIKDKIKQCWASVFSLGVYYYAKKYTDVSDDIQMAVVLQEMVPASISGVCFTSNPVNSNSEQIVIEFCEGLGEVLVSSLITPSNYVVDKKTAQVIDYRCGNQRKVLRYGLDEVVSEIGSDSNLCTRLTQKQLNILNDTAVQLEDLFGMPQDFEWAFAGDELIVLQSRSITTLC